MNSFNLEINIHITLIMVLMRTESTRYTTNISVGKVIYKFEDHIINKKIIILKEKKNKKKLQFNKGSFFI